jgi:hypothetical protein
MTPYGLRLLRTTQIGDFAPREPNFDTRTRDSGYERIGLSQCAQSGLRGAPRQGRAIAGGAGCACRTFC